MVLNFISEFINYIYTSFNLDSFLKRGKIKLFDTCKCCSIMKIPFADYIGPFLRGYEKECNYLCNPDLFGNPSYIRCFAFLGVALNLLDIIKLHKGVDVKPFWDFNNCSKRPDRITDQIKQRDCKLCGSVLSLEHNIFLVVATFQENPVLYMPYLFIHGLVFFGEIIVLLLQLALNKKIMRCRDILILAFTLHNWIQVFCAFKNGLNKCDI